MKFTVIVCSSINEHDFRNSLDAKLNKKNDFYLNYLYVNKLICVRQIKIKDFDIEEKDLLNRAGNLFIYYQQILDNKHNRKKKISDIQEEIITHINEDISDYFDQNDDKKIKEIIISIYENINKKIKFIDLKDKVNLFPLKFFNITMDKKNLFIIDDLNKESELIIIPSFPIVMDVIVKMFYISKYKLRKALNSEITKNIDASKKSSELEEDFNEFLWFYKEIKKYNGCNIKEKIQISLLIDIDDNEAILIIEATKNLNNVSDSILITQKDQNARHFVTAILKLIKITKEEKIYELYLFQEAIKIKSKERLTELTLNEDKTCLKFLFFIKCDIKLENIYFSYVFDENNPDQTTINYCEEIQLNYLLFQNEFPPVLNDRSIESKIKSRFLYPIFPKDKKIEYVLINLDINYSSNKKELKSEYDKLKEFLNKKRYLKENENNRSEKLKAKIKKFQKYTNNDFRNNEIEEKLIEEEIMNEKKDDIVGISYLVDQNTKKYLKIIEFTEVELQNLYSLMNNYSNDLTILKVIQLKTITLNEITNFDCAIISVNKGLKTLIDLNNNSSYLLSNKNQIINKILIGAYYLIKFIPKSMILKTNLRVSLSKNIKRKTKKK